MEPLVSVIIPTFSRPTNLIRAIESVLSQSYTNIEIIVVDDNGVSTLSQIETEYLLADYISEGKVTYIKHNINKNGSAARNTGFKRSKGVYVNFLDDDDVFSPQKISRQVDILKNSIDFDATYCDTQIVRTDGSYNKVINPPIVQTADTILSGKCFFNTSTVLFRRGVIEKLGGFDEQFQRHQDYELYLRYFKIGKMIKTPEVSLIKYETSNVANQDPRKAELLLNFFFNQFESEINKMSLRDEIFVYQYNTCVVRYIVSRKYKEAYKVYKKMLRYGHPSLYSYLKYGYHFISGLFSNKK